MVDKRIMVVDPSRYSRSILINILRSHGYRICYEAKSGEEAIEMYEVVMPDLVLVEILMPHTDGVATIKALCETYKGCRALLCVSAGQRACVSDALNVGALDFIAKPYTERGVLRTLTKLID